MSDAEGGVSAAARPLMRMLCLTTCWMAESCWPARPCTQLGSAPLHPAPEREAAPLPPLLPACGVQQGELGRPVSMARLSNDTVSCRGWPAAAATEVAAAARAAEAPRWPAQLPLALHNNLPRAGTTHNMAFQGMLQEFDGHGVKV